MNKAAAINARITPDTKERLEDYASSHGHSKSEIIEQAIIHYLDVMQNVTHDVTQTEEDNVTHDVTQPEESNAIHTAIQSEEDNATQDAIQKLESRMKQLEDELSTTQRILDERLEQDKQQFKGYILGLTCQWGEDNLEEKLEGIGCPIPIASELSNSYDHHNLPTATSEFSNYADTHNFPTENKDISPEDESGEDGTIIPKDEKAAINDDSPEAQIKQLVQADRAHWETVATLTQPKQAREIADFLIQNGFKSEDFSFDSTVISSWKKRAKAPKPTSKTYLAYRVFEAALHNH